jgi:hypothetical protein
MSRTVYWPEHLEDLVNGLKYKPYWEAYLMEDFADDGSGGLTLFIISDTQDSLNPERRIRVRHGFLVPPASYNRDCWAAWIVDRLGDVEMHERNEFVQFNGVREFAPHHGNGEDPYRTWHVSDYATASKSAGDE